MVKSKKSDSLPLLGVGEYTEVFVELEEKTEDDQLFFEKFKEIRSKNEVSQWVSDGIRLIVTHVQIFCLLFSWSLNLDMPWSYQFTNAFSWVFWFQLDYWSWYKVASTSLLNGTGVTVWPSNTGYAESNNIPISYTLITHIGCGIIALVVLVFILVYCGVSIHYRDNVQSLQYKTNVVKWCVYAMELLLLPFGTVAFRWLWCRYNGSDKSRPNPMLNASDVTPDVTCLIYTTDWSVLWPPLVSIAVILIWVSVPVFILIKTRRHIFTKVTIEHEGYVLLKEAEYVYGINDEWNLNYYFLFSSYRRPHVYMRVYMFVVKFLLLICYGALFDYETIQSFVFTGILFFMSLTIMFRPPFRLPSFSIMTFLSFFVNFWNAFIGICIQLETRNAFLQEKYLFPEMIVLNIGYVVASIGWFTFLYLRWKKFCIRVDRPLWPNITNTNNVKRDLDERTRKYLVAIMRAQLLLKETHNTLPLLAPAHELSRRIRILNAYCREAMDVDHVFQHTMWGITDQLIEAHTAVFRKSIFSECSLNGSQESARILYNLLPLLGKRLKQRDEDLILMSGKKRRLLLKMYTLSVFLSKYVDRVRRELAMSRENKGYESDSDFEDDNTFIATRHGDFDSLMEEDSLLLSKSTPCSRELLQTPNIPNNGVVTSSTPDGVL